MRPHVLLTALLAVSGLSAATLDLTFNGLVGSNFVTRTISNSTTGVQTPTQVGVGLLSFNIVGGGGFYAYCIEPQQGAASGTFTIDPTLQTAPGNVGGMSAAQANAVRLLLGQFSNAFSGSLGSVTEGAIQVALWEIVRENIDSTFNVSSGNVTFSNPSDAQLLVLAQSYLDGVNNAQVGAPLDNVAVALTNPLAQDVITQTPEPSTFAMIGLSAVSLIAMARRRK